MSRFVVGLTGGMGSGKSTVARALTARGAVAIDADAVAREVVEPGTPGLAAVVDRFGPGVLDGTGAGAALNRAALAAVVFADPAARADLNAIVHPLVAAESARRLAAAPEGSVVVLDVPLLVEAARSGYDLVVVVEAPEEVRLRRLEGRGVDPDDARRRMAAQASDTDRRKVADVVIDNSGPPEGLDLQIEQLWAEIIRRAGDASADPGSGRSPGPS
ncbi:MAG: dephospho-CoA kinase [Acidimicrobiales bacterium]